MFQVTSFNLVELLLGGLEVGKSGFIEEVAVIGGFLEYLECHFEDGGLEFDDEVDEDLITVLGNTEILPQTPELLGNPTANAAD